ncbi:hypothetical protein IAT40_002651 [Kwoniella sp. CBS 6097]
MGHDSSSRSRSRSRPSRSRSRSTSDRCNPLILCACSFGTPFIQTFLLLAVPATIAVLCFLAGFWDVPVWVYSDGRSGSARSGAIEGFRIGAQGFSLAGQKTSTRQFLYDNSWPEPIASLPLLLLLHLVLSILLITYLVFLVALCLNQVRYRSSRELKRDTWSRVIRKPAWYSRAITVVLTLATGTLLAIDNAVWGIAREEKDLDLRPDVLGYFVNIVALLLWVLWVVLQCAATQDRRAYHAEGGRILYER